MFQTLTKSWWLSMTASTPIPPNLEIHCMIPCEFKQDRFQVVLFHVLWCSESSQVQLPRFQQLWFPKVFKVPKASVGIKITVAGNVQTLADHARLEYRGSDPITVQNAVKLSNICLRLLALKNYEQCNKPRWGKEGPLDVESFVQMVFIPFTKLKTEQSCHFATGFGWNWKLT